jgi:Transposase IS116/IS110/IS902 family
LRESLRECPRIRIDTGPYETSGRGRALGRIKRLRTSTDCGLTAALKSSAGKQQRGPISKQRNRWLQTTLIEAAKLAPRWNPQLAALHARELEPGHRNRATLAVARKLVAYLLAVDKSGQPFQVRAASEVPTQKAA